LIFGKKIGKNFWNFFWNFLGGIFFWNFFHENVERSGATSELAKLNKILVI
jgi:ABC-type polysaccharide/polyol phosphate export permease